MRPLGNTKSGRLGGLRSPNRKAMLDRIVNDSPMKPNGLRTHNLLIAGVLSLLSASLLPAQGVLTWHNDAARTGQNPTETLLSPSNVNSTSFGLKFTLPVDGEVDAQPLYVPSVSISGVVHNVLYVATENDTVYAFDAD